MLLVMEVLKSAINTNCEGKFNFSNAQDYWNSTTIPKSLSILENIFNKWTKVLNEPYLMYRLLWISGCISPSIYRALTLASPEFKQNASNFNKMFLFYKRDKKLKTQPEFTWRNNQYYHLIKLFESKQDEKLYKQWHHWVYSQLSFPDNITYAFSCILKICSVLYYSATDLPTDVYLNRNERKVLKEIFIVNLIQYPVEFHQILNKTTYLYYLNFRTVKGAVLTCLKNKNNIFIDGINVKINPLCYSIASTNTNTSTSMNTLVSNSRISFLFNQRLSNFIDNNHFIPIAPKTLDYMRNCLHLNNFIYFMGYPSLLANDMHRIKKIPLQYDINQKQGINLFIDSNLYSEYHSLKYCCAIAEYLTLHTTEFNSEIDTPTLNNINQTYLAFSFTYKSILLINQLIPTENVETHLALAHDRKYLIQSSTKLLSVIGYQLIINFIRNYSSDLSAKDLKYIFESLWYSFIFLEDNQLTIELLIPILSYFYQSMSIDLNLNSKFTLFNINSQYIRLDTITKAKSNNERLALCIQCFYCSYFISTHAKNRLCGIKTLLNNVLELFNEFKKHNIQLYNTTKFTISPDAQSLKYIKRERSSSNSQH